MKTISIVLATYNGEKYLHEQIDSILSQSVTDFELIICDDCSSDNTFRILKEYAINDRRIRIYRNERNLGFLKNFEKAIMLSHGDYIALCDQDDIWCHNHLELLYENIGERMLAAGNSILMSDDGKKLGMKLNYQLGIDYNYKNGTEMASSLLFYRNWMQGASMMMSRKFLNIALPFPEGLIYHDSWFAALACLHNSVIYIDEPITKYRQHGNNASDSHIVRRSKILTCMKHLFKSKVFPDKLPIAFGLKERSSNMNKDALRLVEEAVLYHSRTEKISGRLCNFIYEMKNIKSIYSIK